jgi:Na+/proline symporter
VLIIIVTTTITLIITVIIIIIIITSYDTRIVETGAALKGLQDMKHETPGTIIINTIIIIINNTIIIIIIIIIGLMAIIDMHRAFVDAAAMNPNNRTSRHACLVVEASTAHVQPIAARLQLPAHAAA